MLLRRPRILFYAVNGLGLGHVTRLIAIAREIRRSVPEAEILFLTSSEAESVIYREGFAAFKAPSKTLRAQAHIRPATYARLLQTMTLNLMAAFNPHLLVVDTFPAGVIQELLPILRWETKKVFVYRVQRSEIATSALMQNTLRLYDLAVIPHHADEEDTPLPPGLECVWTGPILIRDRSEARPCAQARWELGLPEAGAQPENSEGEGTRINFVQGKTEQATKIVYVTFGGGGDLEMNRALTQTIEALTTLPHVHLAVASAPLYRGMLPRHPRVTPVEHYPIAAMMTAFDAAVSAVGYNTTMELLHHGVPTVFVPFARQVDDQEARGLRIATVGAGLCLPNLEPGALRAAVTHLLDPTVATAMRQAAQELVPDSGAGRAAHAILALLPH